jgi:hypothetical protein
MSKVEAVAQYFRSRPGTWISALDLLKLGGALAWRTEVSRCRTQLGMKIDNRTETHPQYGRISFYRYDAPAPGQTRLF